VAIPPRTGIITFIAYGEKKKSSKGERESLIGERGGAQAASFPTGKTYYYKDIRKGRSETEEEKDRP